MNEQRIQRFRIIENDLGDFVLMLTVRGEVNSAWLDDDGWSLARISGASNDERLLPELARRLRRYFHGEPVDFSNVSMPTAGSFHRRCWQACRGIPRGTTRSYGELARLAGGSAVAARAAGQAMRHNPLPVIVPCHRVIASTGSLHGFAGTRDPDSRPLNLKRRLLELEGWTDAQSDETGRPFATPSVTATRSTALASPGR